MKILPILMLALLALFPGLVRADLIKQSSTYTRTVLMTSSSDHITGATGLTLSISASKAGASPAVITPTVNEIGSGRYAIVLTTAQTNTLGALDLIITATGADPSDTHDQIVAFDPADASLLGLTGVATLVNQNTLLTAVGALPSAAGIASAVLGATVDSGGGTTLTVKQSLFLAYVAGVGQFGTAARSTSAPYTITVPWLRLDGTTTAWSYVTTYTDATFSKAVSRGKIVGSLP